MNTYPKLNIRKFQSGGQYDVNTQIQFIPTQAPKLDLSKAVPQQTTKESSKSKVDRSKGPKGYQNEVNHVYNQITQLENELANIRPSERGTKGVRLASQISKLSSPAVINAIAQNTKYGEEAHKQLKANEGTDQILTDAGGRLFAEYVDEDGKAVLGFLDHSEAIGKISEGNARLITGAQAFKLRDKDPRLMFNNDVHDALEITYGMNKVISDLKTNFLTNERNKKYVESEGAANIAQTDSGLLVKGFIKTGKGLSSNEMQYRNSLDSAFNSLSQSQKNALDTQAVKAIANGTYSNLVSESELQSLGINSENFNEKIKDESTLNNLVTLGRYSLIKKFLFKEISEDRKSVSGVKIDKTLTDASAGAGDYKENIDIVQSSALGQTDRSTLDIASAKSGIRRRIEMFRVEPEKTTKNKDGTVIAANLSSSKFGQFGDNSKLSLTSGEISDDVKSELIQKARFVPGESTQLAYVPINQKGEAIGVNDPAMKFVNAYEEAFDAKNQKAANEALQGFKNATGIDLNYQPAFIANMFTVADDGFLGFGDDAVSEYKETNPDAFEEVSSSERSNFLNTLTEDQREEYGEDGTVLRFVAVQPITDNEINLRLGEGQNVKIPRFAASANQLAGTGLGYTVRPTPIKGNVKDLGVKTK